MNESNPWEAWLGKVDPIDLYLAGLPDRIKWMRRTFGQAEPGITCKGCKHLRRQHHNTRHYWKCQKYGITRGAGTDWRLSWPACLLREEK